LAVGDEHSFEATALGGTTVEINFYFEDIGQKGKDTIKLKKNSEFTTVEESIYTFGE